VQLLEAFLERAEAADALQNQHENYRHYPPWIELDRELQERMTAVGALVVEISPDLENQVHRNNKLHFILWSRAREACVRAIGVLKQRACALDRRRKCGADVMCIAA
jgi:hypothetical protein